MSESTRRITKKLVDGLETTGKTFFVWDRDLAGFGVCMSASGRASYYVQYRAGSGRGAARRRMSEAAGRRGICALTMPQGRVATPVDALEPPLPDHGRPSVGRLSWPASGF